MAKTASKKLASKKSNIQIATAFALVFGVVGVVFLFSSHASTPRPALEAEGGTLSSNAQSVASSGASNGAAVKFTAPAALPLLFNGLFTNLGTFANNTSPSPWGSAEDIGTGSQIITYSSATKQAGWPDPYTWQNGSTGKAAAFTSANDGTHSSVRTQVHDYAQAEGSDVYYSFVFYVPSSIPNNWPLNPGSSEWFLISEHYGPPYNSSPAVGTAIFQRSGTVYVGGEAGWGPILWKTPLPRDSWVRITEHIKLSKSASIGIREVWVNGVKQTFEALPATGGSQESNYATSGQYLSPDSQTAHIATMQTDSSGTDELYLNNYRNGTGSSFGTGSVTIFFSGAIVGGSYAAAAQ